MALNTLNVPHFENPQNKRLVFYYTIVIIYYLLYYYYYLLCLLLTQNDIQTGNEAFPVLSFIFNSKIVLRNITVQFWITLYTKLIIIIPPCDIFPTKLSVLTRKTTSTPLEKETAVYKLPDTVTTLSNGAFKIFPTLYLQTFNASLVATLLQIIPKSSLPVRCELVLSKIRNSICGLS